MEKSEISKFQLEILVNSIEVLPDYIKQAFLKSLNKYLTTQDFENKKLCIRSVYNIFNLLSAIGNKELFLNGKIIFLQDHGGIFDYISENQCTGNEQYLFPGCEISKDVNNSYIYLKLRSLVPKNANLKFASVGTLSLPLESLTINTKYNSKLITKLKELLI